MDPTDVYVEQPIVDQADEMITAVPALDGLDDDGRQDAIDHVARMITHNDTSLMLADEGSQTAVTLNFQAPGEDEKMIVVRGKKGPDGVDNEVHVIDPEDLDELVKFF